VTYDLSHLLVIVGRIGPAVFTTMGLLGHWCWWWWHFLAIQKSFALFQIVSWGAIDLASLLCIARATERPLLFLIWGLLLAVSMIYMIFVIFEISPVSCVDFLVVLLLLRGFLAVRIKKSSPGFGSPNAFVSDYEQIDHRYRSGLLHGDLLYSLDVANSVMEGGDDLDVLDIRMAFLTLQKYFT
jgi:hypothetical protein